MLDELIDNLIKLLDNKSDCLLIELLNEKKNKISFEYGDQYKYFSEYELSVTRKGMFKTLSNILSSQQYSKINKLERIIKNDCKECKYSIKHKANYNGDSWFYQGRDNTDRCNRCNDRDNIFRNCLTDIRLNIDAEARSIILDEKTKDLILMKALINKINTKLKKIKSYDAS